MFCKLGYMQPMTLRMTLSMISSLTKYTKSILWLAVTVRKILTLGLLLAISGPIQGYEINGSKWARATTEYYVGITGMSATQISWNTAFIQAIDEWNERTNFHFSVVDEYADPCSINGISSVDFVDDFCGSEYGEGVLAVTITHLESQILGPPYIIEADIVVNATEEFDIFDGPLFQPGRTLAGTDFRRVALHELGHVIGLGHEATNTAIMAPNISDLYQLQADDIAGVTSLHNGLSRCEVGQLSFGAIAGALNSRDCTVQQMTAGGTDDSRLDLYRFDLQQSTQVLFDADSDSLDTVLIVATTELDYLGVDIGEDNSCNSSLTADLSPGSYFLIVNTFDAPVNEVCGLSGDYRVQASFNTYIQPVLGAGTSLQNSLTDATFRGGISADNGLSFGNRFSSRDSLDIFVRIDTDPRHLGMPGFIVVAILIEDQILMQNNRGQLIDVTAQPLPAIAVRSKPLDATEFITVATDLVPAEIGVEEIEANIVVGYGLDSNPSDIIYHSTPLNLIISP